MSFVHRQKMALLVDQARMLWSRLAIKFSPIHTNLVFPSPDGTVGRCSEELVQFFGIGRTANWLGMAFKNSNNFPRLTIKKCETSEPEAMRNDRTEILKSLTVVSQVTKSSPLATKNFFVLMLSASVSKTWVHWLDCNSWRIRLHRKLIQRGKQEVHQYPTLGWCNL